MADALEHGSVASSSDIIDSDDLCPMCHLLLYRPVKTTCNHTFCSDCMSHWADVSITSQMIIVPLFDTLIDFAPSTVEAKCPMCRSLTTAAPTMELVKKLKARYPAPYAQRAMEEGENKETTAVETITVYIGNKHSLLAEAPGSGNCHDWTFFVRPSRTDVIQGVNIHLHPTFRPPSVLRRDPPYEVRRLGWGYFTIQAEVILHKGWAWVSNDAFGTTMERLPLKWTLDFEEEGSMGRCRLKIRRLVTDDDDEWEDVEANEDDMNADEVGELSFDGNPEAWTSDPE